MNSMKHVSKWVETRNEQEQQTNDQSKNQTNRTKIKTQPRFGQIQKHDVRRYTSMSCQGLSGLKGIVTRFLTPQNRRKVIQVGKFNKKNLAGLQIFSSMLQCLSGPEITARTKCPSSRSSGFNSTTVQSCVFLHVHGAVAHGTLRHRKFQVCLL